MKNEEPRSDVWNPMVKLRDTTKNPEIKSHANRLLEQYNAAGGRMIKHELESFLVKNGI